jgi:hypothetical protein
MAKSLDDVLDDVAADRADLEQYRTLCHRLGLAATAGGAMALAGAVFANLVVGIMAITLGGAAFIVAMICLIVRVSTVYESGHDTPSGYKHPASKLRRAEQEYRRMLREEG